MKELIRKIPVLGPLAAKIYRAINRTGPPAREFQGSKNYWEERYAAGGNSGAGSYDKFAEFKARVLNAFVTENQIETVMEFGCGDGNQLKLAKYPFYTGYDVSQTAVDLCRRIFASDPTKKFFLVSQYNGETADLSMSLDVIYHLVEDQVFENYMRTLFSAGKRHVILYASNTDENTENAAHVKHRKFTHWVDAKAQEWKLKKHIPNEYPYKGDYKTGSFADFYIYERR